MVKVGDAVGDAGVVRVVIINLVGSCYPVNASIFFLHLLEALPD